VVADLRGAGPHRSKEIEMTALSSYSTGAVSVAADGTTVTGTSTLWLNAGNVKPGDLFQSGHFGVFITDVTDDTHLTITPWPGSTLSGASYTIWKVARPSIVDMSIAKDVNKIVTALDTSGFFVFVNVNQTVPDPSLGDDGQYAFQPTTGKTWAKVAGVWSYLGIFKAFQLKGAWSGATAYTVGDVATLAGSSYACVLGHTNQTPPNATYWQLLASKGDTGAVPLNPVAAWVTGNAYTAGPPADYVTSGGSSYMCLVSHTSGTFATDLAAGKWGLVSQKGADGVGYGGTSTTSRTIGTGSQAFTTQAGLAYTNGARVRASSAANTSNWMEGLATYSGTTLTITVDKTNGSGTLADWNFNVVGQPGAGDLTSTNNLSDVASAATARANLGVPQTYGQCKLVKSGSYLVLLPFNGNVLTIAGVTNAVPDAGVSLAAAGLTASTTYFIYAYMNSGTMTLEASTTAHATSTTAGNKGTEIKSGDNTRTLVGIARVIAGPAWQDTAAQRFVISWFNRERRDVVGAVDSTSTDTGTSSYTEKTISKAEAVQPTSSTRKSRGRSTTARRQPPAALHSSLMASMWMLGTLTRPARPFASLSQARRAKKQERTATTMSPLVCARSEGAQHRRPTG
jgi:hypothetical protein